MKRIRIGIAPIGWTNDDLPELGAENTFQQTLSEMALARYEGCELGNRFPQDTKELLRHLDMRGLHVCNAWFSSTLLTEGLDVTLKNFEKHLIRLQELGAKIVGISEQGNSIQGKDVPIFGDKPVYSDDDWMVIKRGFEVMGAMAKQKDITLTVHHHMGTGIQTEEEIERLMELTDPSLVSLLFDTGHCVCAGIYPEIILKKYMSRIRHVHLKDVRLNVIEQVKKESLSFLDGVKLGMFTVPGDGDLNFAPLLEILVRKGYEGWWVVEAEQDPAKANPLEMALLGRRIIEDLTGL